MQKYFLYSTGANLLMVSAPIIDDITYTTYTYFSGIKLLRTNVVTNDTVMKRPTMYAHYIGMHWQSVAICPYRNHQLAWKDDGIAYSPNSFVEPSLIGDLEV